MSTNLSFLDNIFILGYFVSALGIGLYFSKNMGISKKQFFLAGKNLGWFILGISLFVANISSIYLFSVLGNDLSFGISVVYIEWLSVIVLLILGFFIAPILLKSNIYTIPQYFGRRFNNSSRIYISILSVLTHLSVKIGFTILAGGLVMHEVLGWDMFNSAIILVLLTGVYTMVGGMNSVVHTQVFQAVIIIIGALLLSVFGLIEVGGFSRISDVLTIEIANTSTQFTGPRMAWFGLLVGAPVIGIWYWCSDQYVMQKVFSARGVSVVKKGSLFASSLKVLFLLFIIIPSIIVTFLSSTSQGDSVPTLLLSAGFLPTGVKGIILAAFFAALMSTLSSGFHAASTLFALDIYEPFKSKVSEAELVLVGRLATIFIVILTLSIIPVIKMTTSLINFQLLAVQAYIAPPIVSVLLIAIFWKNASNGGAIWALVIGGLTAIIKIIISLLSISTIENNQFFTTIDNINHIHFASLLFFLSSAIMIIISLLSSENKLANDKMTEVKVLDESSLVSSIKQLKSTDITIQKSKSELIHK